MKKTGMLERAVQVLEMHQAKVRFIPTLELQDDRVVMKIHTAWIEAGKPERVNIYHESGERVKIKRRKKKPNVDTGAKMQKKYRVYGVVYGTKYLGEFEAESPEEAEQMGLDSEENYLSLCHQCGHELSFDDSSCSEANVEEVE